MNQKTKNSTLCSPSLVERGQGGEALLQSLVRPNIWTLKPYSSARDEFSGSDGIFLDANENPFGSLNRYPDPYQRELKKVLSEIKNIPQNHICIGNGSDEIIDLVYRIFANPGKDSVIICPPTYGMYEVSARINDVNIVEIPLIDDFDYTSLRRTLFQLDTAAIQQKTQDDPSIKLIFICSPNNPTGNCLKNVDQVIENFNGIVVIDEAYIDFCDDKTHLSAIKKHPNLIVMQTFSKALALAGVRVGVAYSQPDIIGLMNKVKPPYNVSKLNQEVALQALLKRLEKKTDIDNILEEKKFLFEQLEQLPMVKKIYPSDANFLLVEVDDADYTYNYLVEKKVIVRNRHSQIENCIRITIGTPDENRQLLNELQHISDVC